MSENNFNRYKEIFHNNNGILRYSQAMKLGIPRYAIDKFIGTGELTKESRGIYRLKDLEPLSNPDLVQVSVLIPKSVICLISALYFYNLTTQIPHRVYIALKQNVKAPKIKYPPIKVFHFSDKSFIAGIEDHVVDGIKISIYSREKTIADCFKFRKQIETSIALEALKDYMNQPNPDIQSIIKYAKINRVENVIRPYLETLV